MSRSQFFIGGEAVRIDRYRWVRSDHKIHGAGSVSMAQVTLPGMDGELSIPVTRSVGAVTWTLSMAFFGDTYAEMIQLKADFERLVMKPHKEIEITEKLDNGEELTAYGYLTEASIVHMHDGPEDYCEVDYTFHIPSGVWLGPEVTFTVAGIGPHTVPDELLGGSAPMYETKITLLGGEADFLMFPEGDPSAAVGYRGPVSTRTTIEPRKAISYTGITANTPYLVTGSRTFYLPASGRFVVANSTGVATVTITARKAVY